MSTNDKHNNYEMICAKAANMNLILFRKTPTDDEWVVCRRDWMPTDLQDSYFLCLPEYKKECLAWLNGANVQEKGINESDQWWSDQTSYVIWSKSWHKDHVFMNESLMFRVKPRKEIRWIVVFANDDTTCGILYKTKLDAQKSFPLAGEECFIEIEVEV